MYVCIMYNIYIYIYTHDTYDTFVRLCVKHKTIEASFPSLTRRVSEANPVAVGPASPTSARGQRPGSRFATELEDAWGDPHRSS